MNLDYIENNKIKVPVWVAIEGDVLISSDLTSTEKILYALISALSNNEHKKCFATNKYLGAVLNISSRDIQFCLKKLCELKLVEIKTENNKRSLTTTVNAFISYRHKKIFTNHEILDYDWLNDDIIEVDV